MPRKIIKKTKKVIIVSVDDRRCASCDKWFTPKKDEDWYCPKCTKRKKKAGDLF